MGKATAQDVRRAQKIADAYGRIQDLRREINDEFKNIKQLVADDGQPVWEVEDVEKMRITHRMVLNHDLMYAFGCWTTWAENRKSDL